MNKTFLIGLAVVAVAGVGAVVEVYVVDMDRAFAVFLRGSSGDEEAVGILRVDIARRTNNFDIGARLHAARCL